MAKAESPPKPKVRQKIPVRRNGKPATGTPKVIREPTLAERMRGYPPSWRPMYLVRIYQMLKLEMREIDIAQALSVDVTTLRSWRRRIPEVAETYKLVDKEQRANTLPEWIYGNLSPELRNIWDRIMEWEADARNDPQSNGIQRIELMLQDQGTQVRQQLFLYALTQCSFSPSKALQKVRISKRELDRWINQDPGFAELLSEIEWHKGNFFESSLVRLVEENNPIAILFANKTFNADRGFNPARKVEMNVSGNVSHTTFDMADLLPLLREETVSEIMTAIRSVEERKSRRQLEDRRGVGNLNDQELFQRGEQILEAEIVSAAESA